MTPEELLNSTAIGNGLHRWAVDGGSIEVTTAELEPILREAYACHGSFFVDDWYVMISWDEEDGWFVH